MTRTKKPTCLPDRQKPTDKQTVKNGEADRASTGQFAKGNPGRVKQSLPSHNLTVGKPGSTCRNLREFQKQGEATLAGLKTAQAPSATTAQ